MIQESHESINLFNNHKQLQDIIDMNHPLGIMGSGDGIMGSGDENKPLMSQKQQ